MFDRLDVCVGNLLIMIMTRMQFYSSSITNHSFNCSRTADLNYTRHQLASPSPNLPKIESTYRNNLSLLHIPHATSRVDILLQLRAHLSHALSHREHHATLERRGLALGGVGLEHGACQTRVLVSRKLARGNGNV